MSFGLLAFMPSVMRRVQSDACKDKSERSAAVPAGIPPAVQLAHQIEGEDAQRDCRQDAGATLPRLRRNLPALI